MFDEGREGGGCVPGLGEVLAMVRFGCRGFVCEAEKGVVPSGELGSKVVDVEVGWRGC